MGSLATALGVLAVLVELAAGRRQRRTELEDGLSREYRTIAAALPPDALLDRPTTPANLNEVPNPGPDEAYLQLFLAYIDLCNQQVFLRMQRRISFATWKDWHWGIRDNLTRERLAPAWSYIRMHAQSSFHELAELATCWHGDHDDRAPRVAYQDPALWERRWWRAPRVWWALLTRQAVPERPGLEHGVSAEAILTAARRRRAVEAAANDTAAS